MISRNLAICALALAVASCSKGPDVADGTLCFPPVARRWIAAADASPSAAETRGPTHLYIDGSASMAGFIKGGRAQERPLADLVGMLPGPAMAQGPVAVTRFDRDMTAVAPADLPAFERAEAYLCPRAEPRCAHQESHIDRALADIARADPRTLSLVVTDLWLDNVTLATSDGVALDAPLFTILDSGRSIAVYGFESPYDGRVDGLPSGRRDVFARRHYLYLLAIGPARRVEALRGAMARAPSSSIARDLASGRARYALFTLDPAIRLAADDQPFVVPAGGSLERAPFLTIRQGVRIEQVALARAAALHRSVTAPEPPAVWHGVATNAIPPGTVWAGPAVGETALFRQAGNACGAGDWRVSGRLRGGWTEGATPGFALAPADAAVQLAPGTWLLVGSVRRSSLASPNPATAWMRAWSFDAAGEAGAVAQPVMPTLNLAETARLLEAALARAAEHRPVVVGGFALALRVDK